MREANAVVVRCGVLLLVTVCASLSFAVDWDSPIRVILALVFLLFVPGLAIAELIGIRAALHRFALATGTSLAVQTLVAVVLLYAGVFSVAWVFGITAGLTVIALAVTVVDNTRHADA